ncbi:kinase-like domain-containing protein [Rhizophagus clarus]|uniref:Kinase-like domain-containing protein n=1 Tax=Rhizophagus clarus TaxID=94130 RepID=A0A8H3L856_9GLOM|nr:kinase-like domain-containing protein [Rhizophagus clarus]
MSYNNKDEIRIESELNELNIIDTDSGISCKNCFSWCQKCVPRCLIEGWTSGNNDIDEFIKGTIYSSYDGTSFLEWVPFDRFEEIKHVDRVFTFDNLSNPVNFSIITSYLDEEDNKDCQDSKLFDLEIPN